MTKLFVKFQFIEQNKINPDRLQKSVGVISLFSADQICLSVGATIGRPRAFNERPYKIDTNFLMRTSHSAPFFYAYLAAKRLRSPMLFGEKPWKATTRWVRG